MNTLKIKNPTFWFGALIKHPYIDAIHILCSNPMGVAHIQVRGIVGAYIALRGMMEAEGAFDDGGTNEILIKGLRSILADWNPVEEGFEEQEIIQDVLKWGTIFKETGIDAGLDRLCADIFNRPIITRKLDLT